MRARRCYGSLPKFRAVVLCNGKLCILRGVMWELCYVFVYPEVGL